MNLAVKRIGGLFLAVCMVLTMLPMAAFAETGDTDLGAPLNPSGTITAFEVPDTQMSAYTVEIGAPDNELNLLGEPTETTDAAITIPVPGDVLQMEGEGVLKDGVLVFDLGDYDSFLASLAKGERFPITITRPKGGEAGYPVTAKFSSYSGSNDIGFQIFDAENGGNSIDLIEFPANVTSKTIYIGEEYSYGNNANSRGTLSSYIYFEAFDKTTLDTPMLRLETTKANSAGEDTASLMSVAHARVGSATLSVKPGESKVISVTFFPSANIIQQDRGFCEITGDLTLNLKKGTETKQLKPVETIGSILSDVTFVIPATDPVDNEWEVVSITGIKNAANSDVIELTYSDVYAESNIFVSPYTFFYDNEPVFGPVTTDKESYKGLENIQVSVPVQNADIINFGAEFDDYWRNQIGLSYDGGQSFISQDSISWNSATKSMEATFTAPENNNSSAFRIAVEVYRSYGEVTSWRGVFGAFKLVEISAETADFVPIESITVTGIPASGIVCNIPYPLNVEISPENATFSGYAWEYSDPDRARVTGGNLVFYEEGKVTITLRSEETAYRKEQGLPANDDVLVKTFTFFTGAPRLIAGSISVGKSDITTAVTARFNDNFYSYEDEWNTPVLTYEICKSDGTIVKSGNAVRENDVTEVSLVFDDVTPKTISPYEGGEFKPVYTITLKATAGTASVSATANVYITPAPVAMECLTETSNALVGEPATFNFRIRNLLPGYSSRYEITGGGGQEDGWLTNRSEVSDPATGLITLTGSVVFTPAVQGYVSEFRTITLYANNKDEKPHAISKRINVVDQSAARMSVEFCDGLDSTIINPEPGDEPDVLYGIRESKIAELTNDSAYDSQAVFEYLNRMMRTKTLKVAVPEEWGQMEATGASSPVTGNKDISLYLSRDDTGKKVTLSWKNVSTTKEFTFFEDDLSGKVYAFWLTNAASQQPVSISYKNGADQVVEKNVTSYNGYVIIYEPSGIKGDVWMSQESGTGSCRFASATAPRSLSKRCMSWDREYDQASMVVSSLAANHRYITDYSTQAFTADTVVMSEPMASFSRAGNIVPTIVRYCGIDKEGKIIAGTNGQTSPASGSGSFQLPFRALYENPGSQLMLEFEYSIGSDIRTQLEYYDLQALEGNLKYGKANSYVIAISSYIQRITVIDTDGQTQSFPVSSNRFITIHPGDSIEVQVATATRGVKSASLSFVNHRATINKNGNMEGWLPDFTRVSTAVSIDEADLSAFTPNKYTTLRFSPTRDHMTLGCISRIDLNAMFEDGASDIRNIGWGEMVDEETAKYVKDITDILGQQEFFHDEQMVVNVGDAKVKDNTRDVRLGGYEDARFTFFEGVAMLFDKTKVKLSMPSKNPFTFDVKRQGDEYIIRGYVNGSVMNNAGWVNLADRWQDASYDEIYDVTKNEVNSRFGTVIYSSLLPIGSFPGTKGYIEGKAVITPSGDIRFNFYEGRILDQSYLQYRPKERFDLGYYYKWAVGFDGMVRTAFEIKAPDNSGDPASILNFNMEGRSYLDIDVQTAHNGASFDIGVYALKVSLKGEIEDAEYTQKSLYRPYATGSPKIEKHAEFTTGGGLYASNYNRIMTEPFEASETTQSAMKKWYSWFKRPGEEPFYETHTIKTDYVQENTKSMSITADSFGLSSGFTDPYSQDVMPMLAAADSFSLGVRGTGSPVGELSADALSAVRYYNNGNDMIYTNSKGKIIASHTEGLTNQRGFGLDTASGKDGHTFASWGSYRDDLDSNDLGTLGEVGRLKYAAGKTEIKAGVWGGTNWSITTLTDNEMADIIPKTATNGTDGIVVWTQAVLGDYSADDKETGIEFSESRLMFARYNGSGWGKPAPLYTPSGGSVADYSVAMADGGSALITAVMDSGKIVILRISNDGVVTVIDNSLPATTRTSLIYNGKTYTLACFNAEHIMLTLHELSADGFVMNTDFSGVPADLSGDFKLFRNWLEPGTAVLAWPRDSGGKAEATICASRMSAAGGDSTVLISAPITATAIKLPSATVPDAEDGMFVASYDAYIKGNDLKILTVFGESESGESDGSVYFSETQAQFKNTIETAPDMNEISGLMPGLQTNFNIKVKNKGFVPITSIQTKIDGESAAKTVSILPNDETVIVAAYTPARNLPDSIDYTVTAVFADGSESTATGSISLRQTDIAAEILSFSQENGNCTIKALISNNTPFSLLGKTMVAGIYKDSFGMIPVTDEKVTGSKFESETLGTSVLVDFTFTDTKDLPQSLYLIAKAYDSSDKEIPDNNSMNNILTVTNIVLASATSPGDNGGGLPSSGGSSSGSTTTTTTTPEKTPDQPVTAVVLVTATAGTKGSASAAISDKAITDAIAKAQADAEAQGKTTNGTTIALQVTMPKGSTSLTATLTQSSLDSLVSAGVSQLELNGAPVFLGLDLKALQEIQKQSSGNISITIAPATGLSKEAKTLIGNRPVYNITISYIKVGRTVNVTSLGSGTATLAIPYTPGKNEAVGYLFGVYMDEAGKAQRIPNSTYDVNSRSLVISTSHFSAYGVGYTAPSARFSDIGTHWGKEAIDYVVGRGLLSGTSETTFAPNTAMTRGMLVTALGRLADVEVKAYTTNSFTDVKADSAFRPYIEWAYKKGIVQGIGNQQFAPDRAITREEIAVIFANYAKATSYKLPVTRETTAYADANHIGSVYKTAVVAMQESGIMMGGTNNRFNPKSNATRAEVSSMLYRYIKLTIDPATAQGWALNDSGQWLYYKDGKPLDGTQTINGAKHFFDTSGTLKTGWVKDGDDWRYYSGNKMLVGWWDIGSDSAKKTYYFTKDSLMVSGKWLQVGGKWYYFNVDGSLARNTKIDEYEVDENGVRKTK